MLPKQSLLEDDDIPISTRRFCAESTEFTELCAPMNAKCRYGESSVGSFRLFPGWTTDQQNTNCPSHFRYDPTPQGLATVSEGTLRTAHAELRCVTLLHVTCELGAVPFNNNMEEVVPQAAGGT